MLKNLLLIKSLLDKGLNLDGVKAVISGSKTTDGVAAPIPPAQNAPPVFNPQRPVTPKLTSLYPVNNQEALNNWLRYKRK